jgi:hypothetical protein
MFGSLQCPACVAQKQVLHDHCVKKGIKFEYFFYDLDRNSTPLFLRNTQYIPVWYIKGKLIQGLIPPEKLLNLAKSKNAFGSSDWLPSQSSLRDYEKGNGLFPNGKGFDIPPSWEQQMKKEWGNSTYLNSGKFQRGLGPGADFNQIYKSDYFHQPRMSRPGDDYDTAMYFNEQCNVLSQKNPDDVPGFFSNSTSGGISPSTMFGRKKRTKSKKTVRFGDNLYSQMGPAYEINNDYLMCKNTVKNLRGGATQSELPKVQYNPLEIFESSSFGKKKKKKKPVGEGSTLVIKKGKVKVKNY